jgi:predicted site-specific integrase-resolvase
VREGKVVEVKGRWRIPYSEIERLLNGRKRTRQIAIYTRVSPTQKDYLESQSCILL